MKIKSLALQALIVSLLPMSVCAQKKTTVDLYGFVAAQSFMDSRKNMAGAEGFLSLYPAPENKNLAGTDENAVSNETWYGTMARFGVNIKGPEIFGAASRARAEIEFSGHSQTENHVLYRHAFIALDWDDETLLLGQTWHPMNDLFPSTVSIALGSPFNALNRSPQLRGEKYFGKDKQNKFIIATIFQALNTSVGPNGKVYNYNRFSGVPMIYAGADFAFGDLKLGAGAEYQRIVPFIDSNDNNKKYYLNAFSGMIQAQYNQDKLSIKAKALVGQNMSHLGICSGYGRAAGTDIEFVPLTAATSWAQVQYGDALKWGIFSGYMKNLGASKDLNLAALYVNGGGNIDQMWRIAPSVSYTVGNMNLACEYELTTVAYGDVEAKGTVTNTNDVSNHRVLFSVMYSF